MPETGGDGNAGKFGEEGTNRDDRTGSLTGSIFAATYAGLALGKVPGPRMDR